MDEGYCDECDCYCDDCVSGDECLNEGGCPECGCGMMIDA